MIKNDSDNSTESPSRDEMLAEFVNRVQERARAWYAACGPHATSPKVLRVLHLVI